MATDDQPMDPDTLLQSLLAEADPTILARFTGQSPVEAADDILTRLGAGEVISVEPSLDVGEADIIDVSEDALPVEPNEAEKTPAATESAAPPQVPEPPARPIRADGLPVAVVDLWGDLDDSSPPLGAPPTSDQEED